MKYRPGTEFAHQMDREDPLKDFKKLFFSSDEKLIYLDGNSLGRLPVKTRGEIRAVTEEQWGTRLIRSWNEGWYERSAHLGSKLEKIIGAKKGEVAVCDSTSTNLYKLAYAAVKARPDRHKIVSDAFNFPTDLYILQGIVEQLGNDYHLELAKSEDGISVSEETLKDIIDEDTALVVLSHVAFKSAFMYDMEAVTNLVHSKGALMLWDLSHAAGAVPLSLSSHHVDMAVGCTYKYLNGGPGSPAYLYVNKKLQEELTSPIWGWFGDANPFDFNLDYRPANSIRKFLVGTPPILSLEAIGPGLDITLLAGMHRIREKSIAMSEYLVFLYDEMLKKHGFLLGTPRDAGKRGSHVSLQHPEAYRICKAMIDPADDGFKVIPDFREPDNIRLGIAPLYNSYLDIYQAIECINAILETKIYEKYSSKRDAVT